MTKANVTNKSEAPQGVRSAHGVVYIKPGASRVLEFGDHELERAERRPFLSVERISVADDDNGGDGGNGSDDAVTFVAKHKGAGKFSVFDNDGEEVASGLSKADAEAFNALSDVDKAEYVGLNPAE